MIKKREWLKMSQTVAQKETLTILINDDKGCVIHRLVLSVGTHHKSPGETVNDAADVIKSLIKERFIVTES